MTSHIRAVIVALVVGIAAASLIPGLAQTVRKALGLAPVPAAVSASAVSDEGRRPTDTGSTGPKVGIVRLTPDQITAAGITLATAEHGTLARRIVVPGTIIPHADRIARVSVKLSATVAELRKKIGDAVAKDEVIAVLESREVADAKSEYLAARLTNELQQELFERDKRLWEKTVSTEQQFLRSRNLAAQTRMKLDIARQKLFALGLDEQEIAALPNQPETLLRRQDVRSPIAGRVVERKVDVGTAVGRDNLETELFVVVDLDVVWVDLAVSPGDLPAIKEGQSVSITARGIAAKAEGKVMFISPLLDKDTRAARVVAEVGNREGVWRPGSFVTGAVAVEEQRVDLAVPTSAIKTIGSQKIVFVRVPDGFEKRPVLLGRGDDRLSEVVTGLQRGETIATANAFLLKAELLKGLAED